MMCCVLIFVRQCVVFFNPQVTHKSRKADYGNLGARAHSFFASHEGASFYANSFLELNLSRPLVRACEALGYKKPTPIQVLGKIPYRSVRTGPIADWYADRSLLGGTAKIDRRRSIEGEKGKKKRRRRKNKRIHTSFPRAVLACASSPPTRCPHPRVARASSSPTGDSSPVQGDRTSPRARRKISETSTEYLSLIFKPVISDSCFHSPCIGASTFPPKAYPCNQSANSNPNKGAGCTVWRIIDHLRNSLSVGLEDLAVLILDEADRLLELGFSAEIQELIRMCPKRRQTMLFSATMTEEVDKLIKLSLNKPVRLEADPSSKRPPTLTEE
ncbi:hypothetical protein GW17_00027404 [Ensete ventricosum]|nr:hypothetical protein GW17_00027404 [Ensete ventricosum]